MVWTFSSILSLTRTFNYEEVTLLSAFQYTFLYSRIQIVVLWNICYIEAGEVKKLLILAKCLQQIVYCMEYKTKGKSYESLKLSNTPLIASGKVRLSFMKLYKYFLSQNYSLFVTRLFHVAMTNLFIIPFA